MSILVTGGAGFIGSNFVLGWLASGDEPVINLDLLTYAGNAANLAALRDDPRHLLVHGDIADAPLVRRLLREHRPRAIVNFAAESHVDRAIRAPDAFVQTNVVGTFTLLEAARAYCAEQDAAAAAAFRFLHVSTDEVYGSLAPQAAPFTETHPYQPNNPYSASKAASDHMVRSYRHTYGLPAITTHCCNNYGPRQFPEKLIPLVIHHALAGRALPLYDDGMHVRDWLYVADHCAALECVLRDGQPGQTYNIGAHCERTNLEVVHAVCALLDQWRARPDGQPHAGGIAFIPERPGHDRRYAIDAGKIQRELGWRAATSFEAGLRETVRWYLDHPQWVADIASGAYRHWLDTHYGT
ncbi:dTDP-glucose 4,6-dehydratase [Bordetella bronchiseptica]|uniref:dTDP-glucose 4,6-dehydratase n=1 Tax=Bordetella bronchiseptica TaxID=518 RepID=UPI0004610DBB|nr:dTDP-glucose 4,6-dehydratase [Bordetella bronchiseptica]KDD48401.1 dTDP-glucose 4,6-dehydratase [Bordetella bronchiseptica MBORD901]QIY01041.1 dTDP-glucose 4,6-dehydratase [Bordetella bronchiseptica]